VGHICRHAPSAPKASDLADIAWWEHPHCHVSHVPVVLWNGNYHLAGQPPPPSATPVLMQY